MEAMINKFHKKVFENSGFQFPESVLVQRMLSLSASDRATMLDIQAYLKIKNSDLILTK